MRRWALAWLLFSCGCGSASPSSSTGGDPAPTLSSIREGVFLSRCTAACHSGGVNAAGGLDMSLDLHGALVGVPASAPQCAGQGMRVVAGEPEESLLFEKVTDKIDGAHPRCGDTMPLGADSPPLSASEVELVRGWIEGGALDD